MRRILRRIRNLFRIKVQFIDQERNMKQGYLVQYLIRETDGKKVLKEPLILAMVEPINHKDAGLIHFTIPASDVQILG